MSFLIVGAVIVGAGVAKHLSGKKAQKAAEKKAAAAKKAGATKRAKGKRKPY